ncbi:MAG TPA: hypothetical protein VFB06_11665 [Streptosporangiaceae bacterium]|nr:hypothetical protein [Streptosporangiaceae bacterium]
MSHQCPLVACDVKDVPDDRLLCRQDWARVPKPLQQAVYRAWDHGRGRGTKAHSAACAAAISAAQKARTEAEEAARPSPHELWERAGGDPVRYRELMYEHGHLLKPGDDGYEQGVRNLSCGWPHRNSEREATT